MNYKRLTTKCEVGIGLTETSGNIVNDYEKIVNRLAELEDKIENGTLVELPCKCIEELERELIHIEIQNMIRSLSTPGKYYSLHKPKQKI